MMATRCCRCSCRAPHGAVQDRVRPIARCVVLIEACEESGSYDLPFYVDHLASRIGDPSLVVCLDSGCGNYDQLWLTTSLRGMIAGVLRVEVLTEGVHSGDSVRRRRIQPPHPAQSAVAARRSGPHSRLILPPALH